MQLDYASHRWYLLLADLRCNGVRLFPMIIGTDEEKIELGRYLFSWNYRKLIPPVVGESQPSHFQNLLLKSNLKNFSSVKVRSGITEILNSLSF